MYHIEHNRDLDEKVEALQADIAKKQKAPPKNYDLESQVTRLVSLADEKVGRDPCDAWGVWHPQFVV
jgi:hypothetical protein